MYRTTLIGVAALALTVGCATGNDPCDPNPCTSPPPDSCDQGVAFLYPANGQCASVADQVECTYEPAEVNCADMGQFCHEGVCLSDPCNPNPCVSGPSPTCDVNTAVTYEQTGSCETNEGNVECTYDEASRENCALAGEVCEAGSCVASVEPCNPNPCTSPPADFCTDDVASVYPSEGNCTDNGGTAECDYVAVDLDCGANGLLCDAGQCVPDPCNPNPCFNPPADSCSDSVTLNTYATPGTCTDVGGNPDCDYPASPVDCSASGQVCDAGLCVTAGDPCNPNPCTAPGPSCNGDVAETFSGLGTCTDVGGSASCSHTPATSTDCTLTGEVCLGGACVPAGGGTVFISEYVEGSSVNKYLEIYNGSASAVNLGTYTVEVYFNGNLTVGATLVLNAVVLLPGEVYVIADDGHALWTNPGPDQVFTANLWNGNDAIRLMDGTTQVDIMGVIGDGAAWGQDVTLVRNAGINTGGTWDPGAWTSLAIDTHQLGSHTP